MSEAIVRIENATRRFGAVVAVDDVTLEIARGEFLALLGPSGCGKTTLMRMIAGFEELDAGRIFIDGVDMHGVPAYRRPVNMMFQSYALFPHMSVARNIGFGLVQAGIARGEIETRVAQLLKLMRLEGMGGRMPHQLSGGQKQRVALARALAPRPRLLLLDEPLGALDRKLREETQFELMALQRELGLSFLAVTHDQDEAMAMAQRIALMRAGGIEQIGDARQIYEEPASRFAAEFIGEVNLFEARLEQTAAGLQFVSDEAGGFHLSAAAGAPARAFIAVRPERLTLGQKRTGKNVELEGVVADLAYRGGSTVLRIEAGGKILRAALTNAGQGGEIFARGDRVFAGFGLDDVRIVPP